MTINKPYSYIEDEEIDRFAGIRDKYSSDYPRTLELIIGQLQDVLAKPAGTPEEHGPGRDSYFALES